LFQKNFGTDFKETSYGTSFLRRIKEDSLKNKAYGCILGAYCGDACGAYYENTLQVLSNAEMEECMDMNGGGVW